MIFKCSHRVFHPWVERGIQKLYPSILSISRHFTEENLIATSTNSRQMFLKSKMVKCLQTEIARISNMVLILQKLSWDSKVFLTLETEEEKGGWYNKVQTEMGPGSLWVRTFTKACRERYSNQYLNSKKRGWESQQIKMD